jgi:hypothetical protein
MSFPRLAAQQRATTAEAMPGRVRDTELPRRVGQLNADWTTAGEKRAERVSVRTGLGWDFGGEGVFATTPAPDGLGTRVLAALVDESAGDVA